MRVLARLIAGAAELALYHELDLVDHWYMNTQKEEDGVAATFLVNTVYFFLLLSAFVSVTLYVNILLSHLRRTKAGDELGLGRWRVAAVASPPPPRLHRLPGAGEAEADGGGERLVLRAADRDRERRTIARLGSLHPGVASSDSPYSITPTYM